VNQSSWDQHCSTLLTASKGTISYGCSMFFTKILSMIGKNLFYWDMSGNDFYDVVNLFSDKIATS